VEKKCFLLFAGFGLKNLPLLNNKAMHNLKTKSSGIILTSCAMVAPISAFLLFSAYEVACGEE